MVKSYLQVVEGVHVRGVVYVVGSSGGITKNTAPPRNAHVGTPGFARFRV